MKITNKARPRRPHRLVRRGGSLQVHEMSMVDGVMRCVRSPKASVKPAKPSSSSPIRSTSADGAQTQPFEGHGSGHAYFRGKAGKVDIEYTVEALGAGHRRRAGTVTAVEPFDHCGRRVVHTMAAIPTNPTAASGRPMYQRSRSRARVRR